MDKKLFDPNGPPVAAYTSSAKRTTEDVTLESVLRVRRELEAKHAYRGSPLLTGFKLVAHRAIKKKGRCIQFGDDTLLVHPDDLKQMSRGNAVGRRRMARLRVTHRLPKLEWAEWKPTIACGRFLEEDRFEARYAMYWSGSWRT